MKRYLASTEARRKQRTRLRVRAQGKPRLSVFRSGRHIYVQLIDDVLQKTLVSASSIEKIGKSNFKSGSTCEAAHWVGQKIAERALGAGVTSVVFDRAGYRFHGRVKTLAEAARTGGLLF
jgi:large subunit ribosomal protein L18